MTTCALVLGLITCTVAPGARLAPAEAVRVLTSNTRPYVAPPPLPDAYALAMRNQDVPHNPNSPFLTPATPIQPLAPPWSVTTHYGRNYVETLFNGRPFTSTQHGSHRARQSR
jgi:hypothetical protein